MKQDNPLSRTNKKKTLVRERILVILAFAPGACAAFIFPLMPDYFERVSLRISPLLNVIELWRGRPWVFFAGMPYPATLRLFGDVSGVAAILLLIIFLSNPALALRDEKWKAKIRDPDNSFWRKSLGGILLMIGAFMYFTVICYVLPEPVEVTRPLLFAWAVCMASGSPFCIALGLFLGGYIIYVRFRLR